MDQTKLHSTEPVLKGEIATFGEALLAAGQQFGDQIAFIEGKNRITYGQWVEATEGLATWLDTQGLEPGDPVAIALPSSIDYAVACAAIIVQGGIASGINPRLGPREVTSILTKMRVKAIIAEDDFVLPPIDYQPIVVHRRDLASLYQYPSANRRHPRVTASDLACIVWTSGTTGLPKGACFDHSNLKAAVGTAGVMAYPYDRMILPLPFAHAGYMAKQWQHVAFAMTYVLMPPVWTAQSMLDIMEKERVTVGCGVPTQWEKLLTLPGLAKADLSALRLCTTATAPAPPEMVEDLTRKLGCPVIGRYAMTESPSITGTTIGDSPDVLYRTVGRPQKGLELMIADEAGNPVKQGEIGRIRLRGPTVMRGYWNDPEQTAEVMTPEGWLISSDLGYLDADGNLVLAGRVSDMYIRGGYNVYPLEVENVLREHPAVDQVSVVGVPAPVIGEIGIAFIVATDPDAPPNSAELKAWCRERLADYKTPDAFDFVSALPLTSMMKVDKKALRATASEKQYARA